MADGNTARSRPRQAAPAAPGYPDGRITYANLGAGLLLGAHREEMLGRHLWECLGWLSDPAYEDRYRAAMISRQSTAYLACFGRYRAAGAGCPAKRR
ncbi:PAS domain-containing protein [Streptomyces sp. H39-S7]|uniref:PAS domain-containing protein n=1 Tax=Streptomyces sp. H39-S7 TaxID=3004357 RepID=UPI0022B070BC|nr:PAS domain-containing protein [Streptomyces sp. H39-S7]MCZ4125569.1 PAS domain-containing protein [Streptomyces sp. H39-S7]